MLALLVVLLVPSSGAAGSPLATGEDVYKGTLRITVAYWGPKCPLKLTENPLRLQKTRTYRMPVVVTRNPRARVGVVEERNPFNFGIATGRPLREGGITLSSATVVNDPFVGLTLYEYWRSSLRGTALTGRLARSFRESGLTLNVLFTDELIVPCRPELGMRRKFPEPIKEGARLTGTFSDRRVELTVTGQTANRERRFTARITATRS